MAYPRFKSCLSVQQHRMPFSGPCGWVVSTFPPRGLLVCRLQIRTSNLIESGLNVQRTGSEIPRFHGASQVYTYRSCTITPTVRTSRTGSQEICLLLLPSCILAPATSLGFRHVSGTYAAPKKCWRYDVAPVPLSSSERWSETTRGESAS